MHSLGYMVGLLFVGPLSDKLVISLLDYFSIQTIGLVVPTGDKRRLLWILCYTLYVGRGNLLHLHLENLQKLYVMHYPAVDIFVIDTRSGLIKLLVITRTCSCPTYYNFY